MENYWTSNKPINGLRHFVLVNVTKEKGNIIFLMVSVLDSEINLRATYEELINSGNWYRVGSIFQNFNRLLKNILTINPARKRKVLMRYSLIKTLYFTFLNFICIF